ncbi:hypothetical protein [uncultured Desulfovibrio sp.]|uniref:hypothetical protein n=1 Tax=uncultured Desulfovibrio sp. TaxID=167968 RepID=UPI0028041A1C|nr:hypothetical protein [uncultured Desulfovibrio sp.]
MAVPIPYASLSEYGAKTFRGRQGRKSRLPHQYFQENKAIIFFLKIFSRTDFLEQGARSRNSRRGGTTNALLHSSVDALPDSVIRSGSGR